MNLYGYLENILSNKTVLLYHGLNSNPASDKKNLLHKMGVKLTQEHHDYQLEYDNDHGKSFMEKEEKKAINYNVIMGISFGGYVAYMLACRLRKPVILINPAINRGVTKTKIKEYNYEYESLKPKKIEFFYGENDKSVLMEEQKNLIDHQITDFYKIKGMEHKVPIKFFREICEQSKILKEG